MLCLTFPLCCFRPRVDVGLSRGGGTVKYVGKYEERKIEEREGEFHTDGSKITRVLMSFNAAT